MKKSSWVGLILLATAALTMSYAQSEKTMYVVPVTYRIDAQSIAIPQQKNIGLFGLHALVNTPSGLYGGLGLYSAALGESSGFFALGVEGGIERVLYKKLWGDAGIFVGAGGGHGLSNVVGQGSFWEPHFGLQYDFDLFRLGINGSRIVFPSGKIASNQILFDVDIPTTWTVAASNDETIPAFTRLDFKCDYLSVLMSLYFPKSGTKNVSGIVMDHAVGLMGVEFGHYLNEKNFLYLGMQGAFFGNENGFAILLGGWGHRWVTWLEDRLQLLSRVGLGSAGGGAVDTGGGLMAEGELGLGYFFSPCWEAELDGGYLAAVTSQYRSLIASFRLKYFFDVGNISQSSDTISAGQVVFHQWRVRLGNQTYMHAIRTNGNTAAVQSFSLKIDDVLNSYFYLTGQTAFAYSGNAAGYFSGLIGPGLQTLPFLQDHLRVYTELLAGAAGGAGLALGQGFIVEPAAGLHIQLNPWLGLYASFGKTIAVKDRFNTWTLDAGLSLNFGTLEKN